MRVQVLALTLASSVNLGNSLCLPRPPSPHSMSKNNKTCLLWLFLRIDSYVLGIHNAAQSLTRPGMKYWISLLMATCPHSDMAVTQLYHRLSQSWVNECHKHKEVSSRKSLPTLIRKQNSTIWRPYPLTGEVAETPSYGH